MSTLHSTLFVVASYCHEITLHSLSLTCKSYYRRVRESAVVSELYKWRPTTTLKRLAYSSEAMCEYYNNTREDKPKLIWSSTEKLLPELDSLRPSLDSVLYYERVLLSPDYERLRVDKPVFYTLRNVLRGKALERLESLTERQQVSLHDFCMFMHDTDMLDYTVKNYADAAKLINITVYSMIAGLMTSSECDGSRAMLDENFVTMGSLVGKPPAPSLRRDKFPRYEPVYVQQVFASEFLPRYSSKEEYSSLLCNWLTGLYAMGCGAYFPALVRLHQTLPEIYDKVMDRVTQLCKQYDRKLVVTWDGVTEHSLYSMTCVLISVMNLGMELKLGAINMTKLVEAFEAHYTKEDALAVMKLLYECCVLEDRVGFLRQLGCVQCRVESTMRLAWYLQREIDRFCCPFLCDLIHK